jgi:hypothetical protein
MDVPSPRSNSTVLQKVPLACEEVFYQCDKAAYLRRVLAGSGGPEVLVGASATNGTRQTKLTAHSCWIATRRICRNTSPHWLSPETFVIQMLVAKAASKSLLGVQQQTHAARRIFRAES